MKPREPSTRMEHRDDLPIFRVDVSDDWRPLPPGMKIERVTPPNSPAVFHVVRDQRRTVLRSGAELELYLGELE